MHLNSDYNLLSISAWVCYSCNGNHYWEGYTKLLEEKRRQSAVRGNDGRCVCVVLESSPLTHSGKQESILLSGVTTTFPLYMWVVLRCILLTLILWATSWCIYGVFKFFCLMFYSFTLVKDWLKSPKRGPPKKCLMDKIMQQLQNNFW